MALAAHKSGNQPHLGAIYSEEFRNEITSRLIGTEVLLLLHCHYREVHDVNTSCTCTLYVYVGGTGTHVKQNRQFVYIFNLDVGTSFHFVWHQIHIPSNLQRMRKNCASNAYSIQRAISILPG